MKTQIRKPVPGKASYSDEYKQQALEVMAQEWPRCGQEGGGAMAPGRIGKEPASIF
jgi:hypothetical protein